MCRILKFLQIRQNFWFLHICCVLKSEISPHDQFVLHLFRWHRWQIWGMCTCVQYKAIYILLPEIKTWNLKNITTQATHHQATHALACIQRSHVLQFIESWNLLLEILHILWKLYIFWSAALCICQNTQSQHYYSEILSNPI